MCYSVQCSYYSSVSIHVWSCALGTIHHLHLLHQIDSFTMTQILFNDLTLQMDLYSKVEAAIKEIEKVFI